MNRKQCFGRRDDSSHLLVCPSCRTDARIAAAWRDLRVDEPVEPAEERFVDSVRRSVRRDRAATRRRRLIAAAAAAALFSFFAGLAHETAPDPPARGVRRRHGRSCRSRSARRAGRRHSHG